jgi:prophage tail gpP-like protein
MNLKINHRNGIANVKYFNSFKLDMKYDAVASTFAVNFYYDPNQQVLAELACVSHYHECIFEHNGEVLMTGYILSQVFNRNPKTELAQFGGYSKAGVLEDCEIPSSLYPLQSDGLTFREIASKIIAPFDIKMLVDESVSNLMDKPIPVSTSSPVQKIKSYLAEIATQRNIIISHNEYGDVVFTRARTDLKPILHVEDGLIATSISLSFSGQPMHSQITVLKEADIDGGNAGEATVKNPYCPIVFRPHVINQTSGDEITVEDAAKNALAAELKNIILTVTLDRWEIDGKVIRPNNIITVLSRKNYIYKKARFFIESISFTGDTEKQIAVLTCVLPEVYNGETPVNIFVDAHANFPRV